MSLHCPRQRRLAAVRGNLVCILLAFALAVTALPAAAAATDLAVRYRTNGTVYLNAGRTAGLSEGDRLEVVRGDEVIAELEVVFLADHSASCDILVERLEIQAEDNVRWSPGFGPDGDGEETGGDQDAEGAPTPSEQQWTPPPPPPTTSSSRKSSRPRQRIRGSVTFDWESFTDDSENALNFQRTMARLNLRAQNLGGTALGFRIRLRGQENRRDRTRDGRTVTEVDNRDRLYEAALIWEPPQGRFGVRAGRIGTNPFTGVGFLDGVLARVRVHSGIELGGFYGSRPLLKEFGFESFGQKYGFFTRFTGIPRGSRPALEVVLAGVREEGDLGVSREYAAVETRYTPGGRWSFFQRAELDLNNGWREEISGSSTQLSNLSMTATARISERSRFSISYDRNERYRTEETRFTPEDLFDDLTRQGLRANLLFGRPGGLNFTLRGGIRDRESDGEEGGESSYIFGGGVRHSNIAGWRLMLGADVNGYSNDFTEGGVASLRAAKRFGRGHQVTFTLGGRVSKNKQFDEADRTTQWVRLGGWFELPKNLFTRAEFELSTGDDLEGQRINLGLGYRF